MATQVAPGEYKRAFEAAVKVFANHLVFTVVLGNLFEGSATFRPWPLASAVDESPTFRPYVPPKSALDDAATDVARGVRSSKGPDYALIAAPAPGELPLWEVHECAYLDFGVIPVDRWAAATLGAWRVAAWESSSRSTL